MQPIVDFLNNVDLAETKLRSFSNDIDDRKSSVLEIIGELERSFEIPDQDKLTPGPLRTRFEEISHHFQNFARTSRHDIEEFVKQTEFITQFDKSLIVMVYGVVNSGKSSLGNFIAGIPFQDHPHSPYHGRTATYHTHDNSGAQTSAQSQQHDRQDGFPTDATECTDEIRGFTIGGLTWIDTPGIGSMTNINQDLAYRYVESAELVVYLTSSDSPARASEMHELQRLLQHGKPTLIVVSKFDKTEEDVDMDTGEFIIIHQPKSETERQDQLAWLENQIKEAGLEEILQDRKYSFTSSLIAEQAVLKNDTQQFTASGVADFYKQLTEIITNNAVTLKQDNPKRKFNQLILKIAGTKSDEETPSVTALYENIRNQLKLIGIKQSELQDITDKVTLSTKLDIDHKVRKRLEEANKLYSNGQNDPTAQQDIQDIITSTITSKFNEMVAELLSDVLHQINQSICEPGTWEIPSINILQDEVEVSQKGMGRAIGGLFGAVLGIGLSILFPPLGLTVAIGVGSTAGSLAGGELAGTKKVKVDVGTNVNSVMEKLSNELEKKLPSVIKQNIESIDNTFFVPLTDLLAQGLRSCRNAQDLLDVLRFAMPRTKKYAQTT